MTPSMPHAALLLTPAGPVSRWPTLDRAYLARFTLGNSALEKEVLGLFATQAPLYLQRLLEAETPEAWIEAAHTLRGAAAGLGIGHVAQLAAAAEGFDVLAVGEACDCTAAKAEVVAVLREAVEQALAAIRDLDGDAGCEKRP
ncbi:MAG: Hpt domain-containing protein [Hyphomicrobiaceae bacterium]|nr:Hpt domain-containing protein [Hyphomicrobiaceae bacterium]